MPTSLDTEPALLCTDGISGWQAASAMSSDAPPKAIHALYICPPSPRGENRAALGQLVFQTGCLRWTRLGAIAPTTSTVRSVTSRCQRFYVLIDTLVL